MLKIRNEMGNIDKNGILGYEDLERLINNWLAYYL